jgi:hypothetical protein
MDLLKKLNRNGLGGRQMLALMYRYKNDQITNIVKNTMSPIRILEYKNRLIRKINPIYQDPGVPRNPLNFRSHYYAPRKYFAGSYIDTYWFNLYVIGAMTLLALIALYLDLLRKLVVGTGNLYEKFQFWLSGSRQIRSGK